MNTLNSVSKNSGAKHWEYGGPIVGHLIGHFSHERIASIKSRFMFTPTIRTGCETWTQKVRNATGFSRFIS